jgi:CRP/FNR family transcriptional regulator, dissimilatory nitrate respiration regulator
VPLSSDTPTPDAPWGTPTLASFSPTLRRACTLRHCAAGQTIFLTGAVPERLFFVAEGEAVLSRTDAQGRSVVLQRTRHGFLAEASLMAARYHCDAFAHADSRLIAVPIALLRAEIDASPAMRWAWIAMLAYETRRQRASVERMSLKTVSERLLHKLAEDGHPNVLALQGTRMALAAELGVSHEALYRTIARLKRNGVLTEPAAQEPPAN